MMWSESCDNAFTQAKRVTKFSSIAALPPYLTSLGWGVVLSHVVSNGLEHPITLASRTLTDEQVETKLLIWNM